MNKSLANLYDYGLDILALSLDNTNQFEKHKELFDKVNKLEMTNRVTFNIVNSEYNNLGLFSELLELCNKYNVQQLSLRQIVKPNFVKENNQTRWIEKNVNSSFYENKIKELKEMTKTADCQFIRGLPYGAKLYDINGISVTYFDYCVQDSSKNGEDIRSLIFAEDGHLYTVWSSKASRIF